jgi:hypothetical protein
METGSGRIHGSTRPEWIRKIQEILGNLQMAIGILDPEVPDTLLLGAIRLLHGRLKDMCTMAAEDHYWFLVLPLFLKMLVEHLAELEEFWAPAIIREMIAAIEGLTKT